ncbi:hypothetical protein [Methylocystis hirsuta]|uniref:Uncharacterized protein n=1 Tax=Methylocystis hirsuta TaxID=369798 RepID=A0A3M9XMX1_9HYPH|nr:hypothetical protein [Methylocystis hirsuta]RNJ49344.1 hypothetical protein D1O30_06785 [Methylocystis hirsuta]
MALLDHVHYVVEHASEISTLAAAVVALAPMLVGAASMLTAILPKARRKGSLWWRLRKGLNVAACNVRNARNADEDGSAQEESPSCH